MKTYKYSKFSFFVQMFLVICLIALLLYFEYNFNSARFFSRVVFLVAFLVACMPFVLSVFRRKIILDEESVHFMSVFNSFYTTKEERNFSIKYSDIKSIEIKKAIIPKRISLKIKAKSWAKLIIVEYNMVNHKELFGKLCDTVKQKNSDAFIDEKIFIYCKS